MRSLDTNVLVRFLVVDDAPQAARARRVFERAGEEGLFVSPIVVCELIWVLRRAYQFTREEIAQTVQKLLGVKQLVFGEADAVGNALDAYAEGRGDFADYLIREQALAAGCEDVVTFDRELHKEAGFAAP